MRIAKPISDADADCNINSDSVKMADQDLEIRIRAEADLSAIKQWESEIDRLSEKVTAARTRISGGADRGLLAPVPSELLTPGGAFGAGAAGYEGITAKAAEADRVLKSAAESGAAFGANLTRARQEAIILVRELATGVPTTRTLSSLLGSLGLSIGAASIGGLAFFSVLKKVYEQSEEVAKSISKIGDATKPISEFATEGELESHLKAIGPLLDEAKVKTSGLSIGIGELVFQLRQSEDAVRIFGQAAFQALSGQAAQAVTNLASNLINQVGPALRERQRELDALTASEKATAAIIAQNWEIRAGIAREAVEGNIRYGQTTDENVEKDKLHLEYLKQKAEIDKQLSRIEDEEANKRATEAANALYKAGLEALDRKISQEKADLSIQQQLIDIEEKRRAGVISGQTAQTQSASARVKELEGQALLAVPGSLERRKAILKAEQLEQQVEGAAEPTVQAILRNEAAARAADVAGRSRDADLFRRSAQQYERALGPGGQEQLAAIREQTAVLRQLLQAWQ